MTARNLGDNGGQESVTLTEAQLPAHSHSLNAGSGVNTGTPVSNFLGTADIYSTTTDIAMNDGAVGDTGSGNPVDNMSPFIAINHYIYIGEAA